LRTSWKKKTDGNVPPKLDAGDTRKDGEAMAAVASEVVRNQTEVFMRGTMTHTKTKASEKVSSGRTNVRPLARGQSAGWKS
jgi:hypothetical protein